MTALIFLRKSSLIAVFSSLVALLPGCATLEERRAEGPQATYTTTKDVETVSRCVFFGWQNYTWYGQAMSVLIQPNQYGGNTISSGDFFTDVIQKGGKTQINYFGFRGTLSADLKSLSKACS